MKKILFLAAAACIAFTSCGKRSLKANINNEVDTLSYTLGMVEAPEPEQLSNYLAQNHSDSAYVDEFLKGVRDGMLNIDDKKKMAYQLGLSVGTRFMMNDIANVERMIFSEDSTQHINIRNFLAGFNGMVHNRSQLKIDGKVVDREMAQKITQDKYQQAYKRQLEKQYAEHRKANEAFIDSIGKQAGVSKADKGVLYKVLTEGKGEMPKLNQVVEIKYEAKVMDGTVFDATAMHRTESDSYAVMEIANNSRGIAPGLAEALVKMPVGSKWIVYVPWQQAFGEMGSRSFPPYTAVIYEVELLSVK